MDQTTSEWGAACFGIVIGWVASRAFVNQRDVDLSWLTVLIGIVGGGAVTGFVSKPLFGPYCIGLAVAFLLGHLCQGSVGQWFAKQIRDRVSRDQEYKKTDMPVHQKINYVEYPAKNLEATKAFFQTAFGWVFADYGPDYAAFSDQGIDGGFFKSEMASKTASGAALIVFYSDRLEETFAKVTSAGGQIVKPIYSFPGGRRFHFTEPSGNEFAVWAEPDALHLVQSE